MNKIFIILICGLIFALPAAGQPLDTILNTAESGTMTHYARNSITFAPGYSYKPGGGTMVAKIVNPLIGGGIEYNEPINQDSYSINTSLAVGTTPGILNIEGSARYTIPLDLPKGTAGLQPA